MLEVEALEGKGAFLAFARLVQAALFDQGTAGRTPHFAAGSLEYRVWRGQENVVSRLPDRGHHRTRHRVAQVLGIPAFPRADFSQHHEALGSAALIVPAEDRHAALAHALDGAPASSISCGYRLRPPLITMSFTRPVTKTSPSAR